MRFRTGRTSGNVEDRRGMGPGMLVGGGLGTVVIALIAMFLGVDPGTVLQGGGATAPPQQPAGAPPASDEEARFVSQVLASTEDTWGPIFQQMGRTYEPTPLVLFDGMVQSACGTAQAAMGPFYCPSDGKVYIDLSFYDELRQRFGAPGDFAQAYVIAHEVGHHVQDLLGISDEVARAEQAQGGGAGAGGLSVRLELQADCFAGVWGNRAQRSSIILDPGDVEEALDAASAIGDDRLQRRSQGRVVPDSFTHGTSEQRVRWFRRGFESGDPERCDTFSGPV
jgi:predicted metalloprotease